MCLVCLCEIVCVFVCVCVCARAQIAPFVSDLSEKYPGVTFVKVDTSDAAFTDVRPPPLPVCVCVCVCVLNRVCVC